MKADKIIHKAPKVMYEVTTWSSLINVLIVWMETDKSLWTGSSVDKLNMRRRLLDTYDELSDAQMCIVRRLRDKVESANKSVRYTEKALADWLTDIEDNPKTAGLR